MGFPTDRVNNMADQLESVTDCEALLFLIDEFVDEQIKMLNDFIQEQIEILKQELPLLDIPTSIPAVIKFIRKLVLDTILPRLRAFIKLVKQTAEFLFSLQRLFEVIQSIPEKIQRCVIEVKENLINRLEFTITTAINSVTAPIDSALAELESIQDQLENILENPLDARIVTDSLDGFLASVDAAEEAIDQQTRNFLDEPLPIEPEANTA